MDNLKSSAYPLIDWNQIQSGEITLQSMGGFTKLEISSIILASGMIQGAWTDGFPAGQMDNIKVESVKLAKAILEEVNK